MLEQNETKVYIEEEQKEVKPKLINFKYLQFHGGGEGGDGEGGDGDGKGDQGQGGDDSQGQDGGQQDQGNKGVEKLFTQEELSKIAAKENKKGQEKLLKQLGVTDVKAAQEALEEFKKLQDAQKTDAEKKDELLKQFELEKDQYKQQAEILSDQLAALKADVKTESVEDVVLLARRLVNDDTDIEEAIKQVVEKYPQFKKEANAKEEDDKSKGNPKFTKGELNKDGDGKDSDKWSSAFNWFGDSNK